MPEKNSLSNLIFFVSGFLAGFTIREIYNIYDINNKDKNSCQKKINRSLEKKELSVIIQKKEKVELNQDKETLTVSPVINSKISAQDADTLYLSDTNHVKFLQENSKKIECAEDAPNDERCNTYNDERCNTYNDIDDHPIVIIAKNSVK